MKRLYLIGGAMGVGKTTVGQILKRKLKNSVFLDGDWCWDADPFIVTDETKEMVLENICALLNNFIRCSAYENIIFCWVMHEQETIDDIISRLDLRDSCLASFTLMCSIDTLISRLQKDVEAGLRDNSVIDRGLDRLAKCASLKTIKIDTENKSPEDVADEIAAM